MKKPGLVPGFLLGVIYLPFPSLSGPFVSNALQERYTGATLRTNNGTVKKVPPSS
jgi:hypothetical protein